MERFPRKLFLVDLHYLCNKSLFLSTQSMHRTIELYNSIYLGVFVNCAPLGCMVHISWPARKWCLLVSINNNLCYRMEVSQLSRKGQIIIILRFVDHTVSVTTT